MYSEDLFPDDRQLAATPLHGAQRIMLRMLGYLDRLCTEHGLAYALDAGTLLGAVREGGFIPWDDDMDIIMPRRDYERLLKVAASLLPPSIRLFGRHNDPAHVWPWLKLRDMRGSVLDEGIPGYKGHKGVFIDIFPIDVYRPVFLKMDWLEREARHLSWRNAACRVPPLRDLCLYASKLTLWLKERMLRLTSATHFGAPGARYFNPYCRYLLLREITLSGDDIFPLRRIAFEGAEFCVLRNSEGYLARMYGDDYMVPPPEGQRGHACAIRL